MPNTVLGFDFGKKRVGVAIGQDITGTARPLMQIDNDDWATLDTLFADWRPDTIVVGLPLNMDDSASAISQKARAFAKQLSERYKKPVYLIDERLSTRAARDYWTEQGNNKPTKEQLNSVAAAIILQTWLDEPSCGAAV